MSGRGAGPTLSRVCVGRTEGVFDLDRGVKSVRGRSDSRSRTQEGRGSLGTGPGGDPDPPEFSNRVPGRLSAQDAPTPPFTYEIMVEGASVLSFRP